MLHRFTTRITAGAAAGFLAACLAFPAAPIDDFSKIKALIRPGEAENRWMQIPWLNDLWQARIDAAAAGKPILLWEMDGHPLGCT